MPLTTSSPHKLEQYRTFGGITVTHAPHMVYQYIPLYSMLTHRQSKPVNPVLQGDSTSTLRKKGGMPAQNQADASEIPTAASAWTKNTLDLLNAKYESRSVTDFTFNGLVLPDELRKG